MLTKEWFLSNLRELRDLRDDYDTPIYTDFALLFLSHLPTFSVGNLRTEIRESDAPLEVLTSHYTELVDPEFRMKQDKLNPKTKGRKGSFPPPQSLRCPFANKWISNSCCCMCGRSPQELGSAVKLMCLAKSTTLLAYEKGGFLDDLKADVKKKRKYEFTKYVNNTFDKIREEYQKKGKKLSEKRYINEHGGITYQTLLYWQGKEDPDDRLTRPEFIKVVGFMVATKALLEPDAKIMLHRAGYNISHQFDLDLTVDYFISVMGSNGDLQKELPLTAELFNEALETLGILTKKIRLVLPKVKATK